MTKTTVTATTKQKIKFLEKLSMFWTVVSVIFSAGFTVFALFSKWGRSAYSYILIAVLAAYFLIFIVFIVLSARHDKKKLEFSDEPTEGAELNENDAGGAVTVKKNAEAPCPSNAKPLTAFERKVRKNTKKRIKALKSGLAILKGVSNVLYIIMTITVMAGAVSMNDAHSVFSWIVVSVSLLLAVGWLVFKTTLIILKSLIPKIVRKNTYAVYSVINGKVQEHERLNKFIKKVSDKYRKEK